MWSNSNYMLLVVETKKFRVILGSQFGQHNGDDKIVFKRRVQSKSKYATSLNFYLPKLTRHETIFSKISESLIFNAHQLSCGNVMLSLCTGAVADPVFPRCWGANIQFCQNFPKPA